MQQFINFLKSLNCFSIKDTKPMLSADNIKVSTDYDQLMGDNND